MDQKLMVPLSIVLAGVIVAGAIVFTKGGGLANTNDDTINPTPTPTPVATVAPTIDDDAVLGDANAPVTVIEFGDFQCPFCGQLHENIGAQLRAEYIETGKVKMVYRDFPLSFHPAAEPAAEAAECAKEQGKFWAYHDQLFANQAGLGVDLYTSIAQNLKLNMTQFKSCVDTQKYKDEIIKDYQDGVAAGVDGTPASFINGILVSGAVPYATFKAAVEAALAQ